ncbi:hypothetical protein P4O66_009271 [Electrophorus voltai]|uniref:non-specific serine/threonine protein kinase n=1 Tax=Electrophorus voltai TaxID=2609070 RepID=A0AAD8ZEG2_9TELE|nr:hypothetical protein P4O66_009271 [Electrophorus voltai]
MPSRKDDYEVLYTIGCGSYGKCQKIRRKSDGKILVWKELDYGTMTETEKQMLVSEVNLLRELKHPNIVRYYDRIIDRAHTTLYIVMEYCEVGDLASLITKCVKERRYLEEEFVLRVLAQLSLALKECHGRSYGGSTVLHRDLKPANIFLDAKQNVKLGDFGLARILKHDTSFAKTFVGTPYYMSPDYLRPSVESILQSTLISRHVAQEQKAVQARQRRRSDDSENPRQAEAVLMAAELQLKEQALREREHALKEREERLEQKEQELCARERLSEEKLARAENLLKTCNLMRQQRALSLLCADAIDDSENPSLGKRKVHFAGDSKENVRPEQRAGIKPQEHVLLKKLQAPGVCSSALGQAERNKPLKSRHMQGIR